MRKINSDFIGKNISRFRMGITYINLLLVVVNTISLMSLAFHIGFEILIWGFPIVVGGTWLIGYILDKKDVSTYDSRKTAEVGQRYLHVGDDKLHEFYMSQTKAVIDAMRKINDKETFSTDEIITKYYGEYREKWNPK